MLTKKHIQKAQHTWNQDLDRAMRAARGEAPEGLVALFRGLADSLASFVGEFQFSQGLYAAKPGDPNHSLKMRVIGWLKSPVRVFQDAEMDMKRAEDALGSRGGGILGRLREKFEAAADPHQAMLGHTQEVFRQAIEKARTTFSAGAKRVEAELTGISSDPIDLTLDLGGVKVIFNRFPSLGGSGGPLPNLHSTPHPLPAEYIPQLRRSQSLLAKRGLGFLWYGELYIVAGSPGNARGSNWDAEYDPGKDLIRLFSAPSPENIRLLVHEIGHRYYFRFMSGQDRQRFDSYFMSTKASRELVQAALYKKRKKMEKADRAVFEAQRPIQSNHLQKFLGKYIQLLGVRDKKKVEGWLRGVPATSDYGQTISAEDFAEVFADFVLGANLTRDQSERFKAFLGRNQRRGGLEEGPPQQRRMGKLYRILIAEGLLLR